jgi:hypothetical protein
MNPRTTYRVALICYLPLLIMAGLFYKERVAFIDLALHLFELVRNGAPAIQNYRFVALVTQWLPLAGIKAGLSLETLMQLYSLSFVLLQLAVYLLCGALKQYKAGLVLLLCQLLLVTHTFYWVQSELGQGLCALVLCYALMNRGVPRANGARIVSIIGNLILIPTVAFAHPLLAFPFGYGMLFLLFRKPARENQVAIAVATGLFIASFAIKLRFFHNSYDSAAFDGLRNFKAYFPNYFTLYANKRMLIHSLGTYLLLTIAAIAVPVFYIRRKQWQKLALFCCFAGGYLLLINVCYPGPEVLDFYIENMYQPLAFFCALPLIYEMMPLLRRRGIQLALGLGVALFGLARIYQQHTPYTGRVAWLERYIDRHRHEKLLSPFDENARKVLFMDWATPYEIWLLSTTRSSETASLIITEHMPEMIWITATGLPDVFYPTWGDFPYRELPKRYFRFTDSTTKYRLGQPANVLPGGPSQ